MTTIAVDVDNTLYDFESAARQAFLDLAAERSDEGLFQGAYNPWTEWRSMGDVCGPEVQSAVICRVHEPEVILDQTPYIGAADVLWELVNAGYKLKYISNRSPDAFGATYRWLEGCGFPIGVSAPDANLVCTMGNKIPLVSDCQYIIDDRPKTLVQFIYDAQWLHGRLRQPRLGFGLAFPFNQNLTDVPGVYLAPTWGGIRYYLIKKGVLANG
jgi:hypothetical protein